MFVLVVDHDPGALASIVRSLRAEGCTVEGTTDFQAARLLLTRKPDVLVTSMRLGAYNGVHLAMLARRRNPGIHAIVTGGQEDAPLRADVEALDAMYVAKPYTLRELAAHVLQDQMSPVGKTPDVSR